jgi:hypothetical protein
MKKTILVIFTILLFFSTGSAFAEQNKGFFAGGNLHTASFTSEVKSEINGNLLSSETGSDSGTGATFQGGYNFPNWRLYGHLSSSTFSGFKTSTTLALADWMHSSGFYIGGGLGFATMEWTEDTSSVSLMGEKASSAAVAFQVGGNFDLLDKLEIDFGLRSMSVNLVTEIPVGSTGLVTATGTGIGHLFVGLNYLF